jgi:alpha-N-arabinofuranosidase
MVGGGVSPAPVSILSVQPSSGCKTADLPSQPWVLAPGGTGEIKATVDLAGESGTVTKTVAVTTDHGRTELTLRVNVPAAPASTQASAQPGGAQSSRATWAFDQSSGNVVADSTGNGNNATVMGSDPNWVKAASPDGSGLKLDGASFAEVPGAVVDTSKSFTVSARVSMDVIESKKYQTFVSIDGQDLSGFYLQMNPYAGGGTGRFEFDRMASDAKGATKIAAKAKSAIATNTWYYLVGVYDADAQNISLYLNGRLQETLPYRNGWQATGKTAIGRGRTSGHNGNYMTGIIRDVRVYAYALTAAQVKEMAE